jgi:hypothetical protein
MKHIKKYNEGVGDILDHDDKHLELIRNLMLEVEDLGFNVNVRGYESYSIGYINYDIIVSTEYPLFRIDDINNITNMKKSINMVKKYSELMDGIINRILDNGLKFIIYEIDTESDRNLFFSFIKFKKEIE